MFMSPYDVLSFFPSFSIYLPPKELLNGKLPHSKAKLNVGVCVEIGHKNYNLISVLVSKMYSKCMVAVSKLSLSFNTNHHLLLLLLLMAVSLKFQDHDLDYKD